MHYLATGEGTEMVDAIVYALTRDQALAEIIRAQREERVPMLDYADLNVWCEILTSTEIGKPDKLEQ